MRVLVSPYNPQWPQQFLVIKSALEDTFRSYNVNNPDETPVTYTSIEHVGSTSIPSMPAKPTIDIDIVIPSIEELQPVVEALTLSGQYEFRGDMGIPERWVFRYLARSSADRLGEGTTEPPARNVYATLADCLHFRNHIAIRDVCRQDDKVRQQYAAVKLALAQRDWSSVDEYCEAKNDVMAWMLEQAGMSEAEIAQIRGNNTTS